MTPTIREGVPISKHGKAVTLEVDGYEVRLSNPDKVLFPGAGLTKRDLVDHYLRCAPVMLDLVRDRPVTMRRFPDGVTADGWFQKHAPDHLPDWIRRVSLGGNGGEVSYVVIESAATLAVLANLATVELHIGQVFASEPTRAVELILDLDPPSDDDPSRVRRATRQVRDVLAELEVTHRVKTSGSRGFHVHVPLGEGASPEFARDLARGIATILATRHPEELTIEHRKAKRGGRVLVDWFRNSPAQTAIAAYSPRARTDAPVATPMGWHELAGTDPQRWNIPALARRLAQTGDPWKDAGSGADPGALGRRIAALLREA